MPAISIYKSTTVYPAILLSSSAIALSTLYCKALPETRKKTSFYHHGIIKLLSTPFLFTNGPFRLKKSYPEIRKQIKHTHILDKTADGGKWRPERDVDDDSSLIGHAW